MVEYTSFSLYARRTTVELYLYYTEKQMLSFFVDMECIFSLLSSLSFVLFCVLFLFHSTWYFYMK